LCASAAHGEILATARLHAAVTDLVRAEPLEETSIRGLRQPVRIVRLLDLREPAAETEVSRVTVAQPRLSST
jgi:class 3 adenylate cyclase